MTRSRYNITEAINRLLRVLEGKALTSDTPSVIPGEVLSYNDAWSDLAELFEGSLPNETLHLPAAGVPFASVEEANAGTSNTVVLSPASHGWSHEWGGIYINTGSSQAFTATTWVKITGSFQTYMENSGGEITCDWNDDRIIINEKGTYLLDWNLTLYTDGQARSTVEAMIFVSGSAAPATRGKTEWIVTGSYVAFSGGGYVDIPVSGYYVDVRLYPSNTLTIRPDVGQLRVQKAPE